MIPIRALKRYPVFARLTDDELERVAHICQDRTYEQGMIAFAEGGVATELCLVVDGKIALEMDFSPLSHRVTRRITVASVGKGDLFGLSALVEPHILTLTSRCLERTKVISIEGEALRRVFDENPTIEAKVMSRISSVIVERLKDAQEKLVEFQGGEQVALEYVPEESTLVRGVRHWINLRWIALLGVIVLSAIAGMVFQIDLAIGPIVVIASVIALYNLAFLLWERKLVSPHAAGGMSGGARVLAMGQISLDLIVLTALLHFTGGVENPFAFYYIFHVVGSCILLPRRWAYIQATLAVALFSGLVGLEFFGLVPHVAMGDFAPPYLYLRQPYILAVLLAFATTVYFAAYLATSLAGELRRRQGAVVALKNRLLDQTKQLHEMNDKLVELNKLRDYFLAMVSHDLKSPLVAVESYLQVMLGGFVGEIAEQQREMLERCHQRLGEMLILISDLLDVSRLDAGQVIREFKPVSLLEVASATLSDARSVAEEKGIELRMDVPRDLPAVHAAPHRIKQVLNNLVLNAIKFTPPGGSVTLKARDSEDRLQVEVIDTGIGVPPDELPYIFDAFFRGKRAEELGKGGKSPSARRIEERGVGLGLSITKRIVEAHGGKIWVESPCQETGKGTRVAFTVSKSLAGAGEGAD